VTALSACHIKNRQIEQNLEEAGVWKIPIEDLLLLTDAALQAAGLTWKTVQFLRHALDRKARVDAALARPHCGCGRQMGQDKFRCQQCEIEAEAQTQRNAEYEEILNIESLDDVKRILLRLAGFS
jgi:hypothetical protein